MKVLEIREFTLRPTVNRQKGFFKLPRELRDQIYEYCLIEPSLWDRRHHPRCYQSPTDTIKGEEPPFIELIEKPGDWRSDDFRLDDHDCGLRTGLSALRVNRQMHAEAAPIFWANNVFCWPSGRDKWTKGPRAEYLALIRHISIMPRIVDEWDWDHMTTSRPVHFLQTFWSNLRYCTDLRTLEIPAEYIPHCIEFFKWEPTGDGELDFTLKQQFGADMDPEDSTLPPSEPGFFRQLTSLTLIHLREERIVAENGVSSYSIYLRADLPQDLSELNTPEKCEAARERMDRLGNCVDHATNMIKSELRGHPWDLSDSSRRRPTFVDPFTGHDGAFRMKTCRGIDYVLNFYGMRLSPAQLAENNRLRQIDADKAADERQQKREHMKMLKLKAKEKQRARMRHVAFKGGRNAENLAKAELLEGPEAWREEWEEGDAAERAAARDELEEYRRMMEQAKELSMLETLSLTEDASLDADLQLAKELSLAEKMNLAGDSSLEEDLRLAKELSLAEQLSLEAT